MRTRTIAAIAGAVASTAFLTNAAPAEPTPLVYEGRLSYLDVPVESRADLRFRLFDAPVGGTQLGDTIERPATALQGGAFSVSLDFGAQTTTTWLEVSVRAPAGEGAFVLLTPRQQIDPAATTAVYTAGINAATGAEATTDGARASLSLGQRDPIHPADPSLELDPDVSSGGFGSIGNDDEPITFGPQADWIPNGNNIFYNAGNVSIGTAVATYPLTVRGSSDNLINARSTLAGSTAIVGANVGGGVARGVFGFSTANIGVGVYGQSTGVSGVSYGVDGHASSTAGRGVRGLAIASTGFTFGVYGQSDSSSGRGVLGYAPSSTGTTIGVIGWSKSPDGYGVQGLNDNATGTAVFGNASAATGVSYAIRGRTTSAAGWPGYFEQGRGVYVLQSDLAADDGDLFSGGGIIGVEATKARIELLSDNTGTNGSLISLKEIAAGGGFGDGWNVYRSTQSDGSELRFSYSNVAGNVGTTHFTVTNNGDVGIGRTPAANELEVEGDASKTAATAWLANSDRRIKTDIQSVTDALDTLDRVRLVSFDYSDDYRAAHPKIADHRYLNVIAQEFAQVFPDYVKGSGELLPDGSEILQVDTYPITIYSAAAVQELNATVKSQDARIAQLESKIESMSERRGLTQSSLLWPLVGLAGVGVLAASRRKKKESAQ